MNENLYDKVLQLQRLKTDGLLLEELLPSEDDFNFTF